MFEPDDGDLPDVSTVPVLISAQEYEEEFRNPNDIGRNVFALAEVRDCEAILPADDELQLDIDSPEDYAIMILQMERINAYDGSASGGLVLTILDQWDSRGGNKHVVLRANQSLEVEQRILLQAILGSDRKRELFNWLRVDKGIENPITLFKPKGEAK